MAKIVPLKMNAARALSLIRAAAAETSRVVFLAHAKQRMRQRRITPTQVYSCLRLGVMLEGPSLDMKGGWRCSLRRLAAGEEVTVVVSLMPDSDLVVVTVI